jgi:hypothetical protein
VVICETKSITMKKANTNTPISFQWKASQAFMDLLLQQRFLEVFEMGSTIRMATGRYVKGEVYHFRKYGECRIGFLKDGRVHVLNGPLSRWELFDSLDSNHLHLLLAFCGLHEEHQMFFRNHMMGKKDYSQVFEALPPYDVEWKIAFQMAFQQVSSSMVIAA